jgi:DNA-binding SARP family transcriptional activator
MPSVSLTLCGSLAVNGEGVLAGALGAKPLALLAYLALEPGPHSRDELTALLWGEYPEEKAKASLRQALTHLREALPAALRVDRTSVSLATAEVECDVNEFLRLTRESPRNAADYTVSRFLEGLQLRRCSAFEDWADATRASLVKRMTDVLTAVTREGLATRQWREAARYAERWTALAPLSVAAISARVEALFMAGERELALDAFGDYRTRLAAETGRRPERELLELVERIRASKAPVVRRQATEEWYANAPSFEGSLVGRAREWDALTHAWAKAAAGRGCAALIEGDAGVGKTRLASDLLRWVSAAGGTVIRGRAYGVRGSAPFGPIIEALRSAIDAPGLAGTDPQWLTEVARVVPELRARFPAVASSSVPTSADGWRLFEGVAQLLIALADEAPVAVFIDDLQWCDADSCALLHSLVRRLDSAPVLWCLTYSAGAVERDMPAARLVRALRSLPHAVGLSLQPLTEDEVWQLVRGLGRVSAPTGARRLAARIHEVTTGFPFYVVELLKTLFAQGWLVVDPDTGEWIVRTQEPGDSAVLTLSPSAHEAIAERIECLPDEFRGVLMSIAVSARGCRADVLSHVHGISRLRAAVAGDALVERHLAVEEDGVYRCAHPVIARVVSDALGTSRRREMHRGIALALEAVAGDTGRVVDTGEVARHAEQGGERAMTYRYATLAAEQCEERFAYEEALGWLDMAAAASGSVAETDAVNRMTARLLERAGWRETPRVEWADARVGRLVASDVDLPARV